MSDFETMLQKELLRGVAGQPGALVDAMWLDPAQLNGPEWQYRTASGQIGGLVLGYRNGRGIGTVDNRHVLRLPGRAAARASRSSCRIC
jgi:hypothetical protein